MEEELYGTFDPNTEFVLNGDEVALILEHIKVNGNDLDLNVLLNAMKEFLGPEGV